MPGLKRSRPAASNRDHTEQAALRSDASKNKRIRLSNDQESAEASDEETDEEIQTLQATQLHEKQKSRLLKQNGPSENGIIESITLSNFMCHAYLHVTMGPLINFIIGHNGSGKSAVLTALTVCLGGKASSTNRASSLKSFIKEGTETCTLSVKIKNGGDDGYQQELYGHSIVVERSFSRSGSSSFKIKNSSGRIISTKRSDLEDISDYYALQLDNPINVLTQDNSRQFLSGSGPTEKYKFFIKGVQLEQLNRDYDLLHESIAQMEATFEDKRHNVQRLAQKKEKAKATYELFNRNENLHSKIHLVRTQICWAQVEYQEKLLRIAEEELITLAEEIEEKDMSIREATRMMAQAEQDRDKAREDQAQAKDDVDRIAAEIGSARESQASFKQEALNAQRDERSIDEEIQTSKASLKTTQDEVAAEKSRLEAVNGGSIARRMDELEAKKAVVKQVRKTHHDHGLARADILREQSSIENEQKLFESRRRTKSSEESTCEERLRELQSQGQRRGFRPNMNKLTEAIKNCKDFHENPIGPIGEHIQLKDPQWLSILERSLGDVLEAFIVTSKSDQAKLADLMRKVNCQTSIVIGSKQPIDTSNHEPDREFTTALRVLRIDNEMVKRQLIINQGIEQTILIPSIKEAREVMDHSRLRNVRQCFSHQPHSAHAGERFSYGIGNSLNSSFVPAWNKLPRMRTQQEDAIAFERNTLQRLKREMSEMNDEANQLKSRAVGYKQKLAVHDRQDRNLKADIQQAQHVCDEIQEKIDADSVEEGKLDALKQAIEELTKELAHHEKTRNDAVKEKEKHKKRWRSMEPEIRTLEGRNRVAESQLKTAKEEVHKIEENRSSLLFQKNQLHETMSALKHRRETGDADCEQYRLNIIEFSKQAATVGERVPIEPGATFESLTAKQNQLEKDSREWEQRVGGIMEEIMRDYEQATQAYTDAFTVLETEEKLAQLFRQTLADREDRWRLFRQKISARARATFVFVLSERSFHGHLRINHSQRKLEISVQPDETQRDRSGREAASLSGGEKSYSTICLLLSLWDAVGAPIRCLDEFDVYMDSVNRDVSMKLLVRAARNAVGRQFILISPQAGIIDSSPDVRIIRLDDPERNQTRLGIGNGR